MNSSLTGWGLCAIFNVSQDEMFKWQKYFKSWRLSLRHTSIQVVEIYHLEWGNRLPACSQWWNHRRHIKNNIYGLTKGRMLFILLCITNETFQLHFSIFKFLHFNASRVYTSCQWYIHSWWHIVHYEIILTYHPTTIWNDTQYFYHLVFDVIQAPVWPQSFAVWVLPKVDLARSLSGDYLLCSGNPTGITGDYWHQYYKTSITSPVG